MSIPIRVLKEAALLMQRMTEDKALLFQTDMAIGLCRACLTNNGTIYIAGNGGNASLADHMAAELVGRFYTDVNLAAVSLTNISIITSIGNDYGFEYTFSKQIEGVGKPGDVFIALSTSGNSVNLTKAIDICRSKRIASITITGDTDGALQKMCNVRIIIPSAVTPRIQEGQGLIVHILCEVLKRGAR